MISEFRWVRIKRKSGSILLDNQHQWCDDNFNLQHVKEELADVLVYSQNLLDKLGLDADEIVNMKMDQNEAKYPVEKAKGSAAKYTEL